MIQNRTVSPKKKEEVNQISKLIQEKECFGFINVQSIPANALHKMRRLLRGEVVMKMSKKSIYRFALNKAGIKETEEILGEIYGTSVLIATDMNPFKLNALLKSKAVKGPAKAGDLAPEDILVKAGDTKLLPGPIISELSQHLKLPTMIQDTIHIREDTVTHKTGEEITEKQAQLLARLGIEPMTIMLDFYMAYQDGDIIPKAVLDADFDLIYEQIAQAQGTALALAIELGIIDEETIEPLLSKAHRGAKRLAMELPLIIPELISDYFQFAISQATVLQADVLGIPLGGAVSGPSEEAAAPVEEEEEEEEETGIGGLFD